MMITSAEFVTSAVRPAQFPPPDLPEFAFAGRSNVGKSSLINTLVSRRKLVQTSSTPGKTRLINFFRINETITFVDLPGYGYARVSEEERRRWRPMVEQYLSCRDSLKAVVVVLDIRRTPNAEDGQLLQWLEHRDVPCVLVATKADKLSKTSQRKQLTLIADALETDPEEIIVFSAKSRQGRDALWRVLADMATAPPEDERA
jgi:GTP-binding protein